MGVSRTYPMSKMKRYIGEAGVMGLEENVYIKVSIDTGELRDTLEVAKKAIMDNSSIDIIRIYTSTDIVTLHWDEVNKPELEKQFCEISKQLIPYDGPELLEMDSDHPDCYRWEGEAFEIHNFAYQNEEWNPSVRLVGFARHWDGKLWITLPKSAWE